MSKKINLELQTKIIKALLGQDKNIKELNGVNDVDVKKDDIVIYNQGENQQFYFYRVKKDGTIKIPTEEYCEKVSLGNSGSSFKWEDLKKKIMIG